MTKRVVTKRSYRRAAGATGGLARLAAAASALALGAQPALAAGLCDMRVYDAQIDSSARLTQQGESDQIFTVDDFFVVCFYAEEDGYVTLWDRMPQEAPVERIVPGPHYIGEGVNAAKVTGGQRTCFGTGKDGYYMTMDAADGVGVGLMWLVFTQSEDAHPTAETYDSVDFFATAWDSNALGVGSTPAESEAAPDQNTVPGGDLSACRWENSLEYQYRVEAR